ncbi:MAG: DUF2961 domain-containing protein [Thermoguttaceae bacterium]
MSEASDSQVPQSAILGFLGNFSQVLSDSSRAMPAFALLVALAAGMTVSAAMFLHVRFQGAVQSEPTMSVKPPSLIRVVQGEAARFDSRGVGPQTLPYRPEEFMRLGNWHDESNFRVYGAFEGADVGVKKPVQDQPPSRPAPFPMGEGNKTDHTGGALAVASSSPIVTASHVPPMVAESADDMALNTFGNIGKGVQVLDRYKEADLLRHDGKGCLTHMWFGGDWPGYEKTHIRVYVDGESQASIDMELGLGHGYGFGDTTGPWGSQKLGKTGHPSGVYNTYKIPFGKGIRVTAQRDQGSPDGAPFWWIVRGSENLPLTIAGTRLPASARLRLYKLDKYVAKPLEEFNLCDVGGAGVLYQVTIAGRGLSGDISYLEACMRAYVNGSKSPLMLSSGLEDYFLGTYYFNRGRYANALAGLTHIDQAKRTFSAYRFHDDDPVFFHKGFRLTCRCGEEIDGQVIGDPPKTEYSTYTWLYQW